MAQFRSTADIADEVLQKSGEATNGNSAYETLVITYLNKVQQALIGGASIFSLKVDELFSWARAKNPMVIYLEPPYVTGTLAVINGDIGVTFSDAPAVSLSGWYVQLTNKRTSYRITAHAAGSAVAILDSGAVDPTGLYNFRAYKTDYELIPQYLYIDASNDRLDLVEVDAQIMVQLDRGSYTPSTFLAHVVSKLNLVGTPGIYSGTYDPDTRHYKLTSTLAGGKAFSLLGATGTNRVRSALPLLGFDRLDYVDQASYESVYATNGVSRLVEPFRIFTRDNYQRTVTNTDLAELNAELPHTNFGEGIPTQFARVHESYDGTVTVRFNCFPKERTKLLIDWVPVPVDLQDHTGSIPVIPRKDIDVLIHAAAALILFDKEDTKWESMLKLAGAQLEAMEKKNRAEQFRAGEDFGQIRPRGDLGPRRTLKYGYPWNPNSGTLSVQVPTGQTNAVSLSFTSFQAAALQKSVTVRSLPSNHTLFALIIKHSQSFLGTGITSLLLDMGIAGDPTKFINGFDLLQAVTPLASDSALTVYYPAQSTDLIARVTAVGANLSALSQGSVTFYFQESVIGGGI